MVIQPRIRGFICTTAHPIGCAEHVREQIRFVEAQPPVEGPKRVLVIGGSTGYGLASRIVASFGCRADTISVHFERPAAEPRTASAGWYNTAAFTEMARAAGRKALNVNGDAFSTEIKEEVINLIRGEFGQVDCVIYSLASPRRTHPVTGETFNSVIKPIGEPYTNKTVDFHTGVVSQVTVEPATQEEIDSTIQVMGGEDWEMWIDALSKAGVLADGATTVAYSYVGPQITYPIYREGTIGKAKDHLEATAMRLRDKLSQTGGRAYVSVNKALVTQSSSAIPVVPLYMSLLFKVMKEKGTHEGCVEQMYRLFEQRLYSGVQPEEDSHGRIHVDELEMQSDVQAAVDAGWDSVTTENLESLTDIKGYRHDFLNLFGFDFANVDYDADVNPDVRID